MDEMIFQFVSDFYHFQVLEFLLAI
ncbi:hypothetical protein BpHYR1_031810 [Brachionus plicatilis]|uniref:Uncharacterized protein n=1 Tax=Brachionus plicatilis TaxID=10195 RepID=A0A3M7PI17_BRAPC|nr:hypothetical protein BpHYR1_031810 [Brachionus plicatilis]